MQWVVLVWGTIILVEAVVTLIDDLDSIESSSVLHPRFGPPSSMAKDC